MRGASEKGDPIGELLQGHERLRERAADGASCASAEVIAAYFDHGLSAPETRHWEAHFAGCGRCRAKLAAIARIEAPLAADSVRWRPRWLAGAAIGFAAAAALVVALILTHREPSQQSETVALADRNAAQNRPQSAPAPAAKRAPESLEGVEPSPPAERAGVGGAGEAHHEQALAKALGRNASITTAREKAAPAPGVAAREAAPRAAGPAMAQSTAAHNQLATAGLPGASATVIEPPDQSMVWMIGAHGAISVYADGKWSPQQSNTANDLTAGSAVSRSACWVVGRKGTVLRTIDGVHWRKIPSPTRADLVAVSGRSADEATIVSTDHVQYTTTDGGATWRVP